MTEPTDIRQVRIPTVAVGLMLSVAVIVGTVTWSSARLVARIDHLEATVASIEQTMDMQSFARVEDVSEDLEDIWAEVDGINTTLDGVMDSVGLLLMQNEQSFWDN
jgi:ACT domain-containing protein